MFLMTSNFHCIHDKLVLFVGLRKNSKKNLIRNHWLIRYWHMGVTKFTRGVMSCGVLMFSKPVLKASPVECRVEYKLSFARTIHTFKTFVYVDWTLSLQLEATKAWCYNELLSFDWLVQFHSYEKHTFGNSQRWGSHPPMHLDRVIASNYILETIM